MPRFLLPAVLAAFLAAGAASTARGDDWPQFRRDTMHSAVSSDPVALPLTEIWPAGINLVPGAPPLFEASIWHGRVYYIAPGLTRTLVCADARSGLVIWQQKLHAKRLECSLSDHVAPAVSET